jgi:hypothetical protein
MKLPATDQVRRFEARCRRAGAMRRASGRCQDSRDEEGLMGKVASEISMSLDGFVTDPT